MTVWVKPASAVYHRDPGCSRLFIAGASRNPPRVFSVPPVRTRPCSYCHSKAGYRRYPG